MERVSVESSALRGIGYDAATGMLEIEFQTGRIYTYREVPPQIHQELMSAESKGKYFGQHIRNAYAFN